MLQLIAKDILVQKKTFLLGIAYIAIMIISLQGFGQNNGSAMLPAGVLALTYILIMSACAYDDKNKADILLNSLPLQRHLIVMARYLSAIVFAAFAVLNYVILISIINFANIPLKTFPVTLEGIIGSLLAVSLIVGIYLPVYFKLGYIKSKLVNFITFFGMFFLIGSVSSLLKESDLPAVNGFVKFFEGLSGAQAATGFIALILLILSGSYLLSVKFYRSREF